MERLGLSINPVGRLTQLLLLAVTVLSYSVVAMAVANSLFVSHVGAGNLPFAFILIGLCSMPAYVIFSQIIDRYSRPKLFRYILLLSIFAILGLRLLLSLDVVAVYYILLIAIFFQWDFHNNILYPSLLTDYFTTLEYKQYAPFIGIAQAVGTMLGGGLTVVLSHYLRTRDLLFCLPVLFAVAFAQLVYLEKSQRRIDRIYAKTKTGIIESLQTFPDLVKRYPLVSFLASSSFLLVIIYISSEFLWFNIYGQHFSEEALTEFLGLMRILISLVQVVVLYALTRPLLKWLGVAQMNPVYPLTTLISFSGLLLNFNLLAAIGLHINGDALYKAINLPVHQLNYNGVPQEFIGRVRALSDGVIYSVGLTLAGVLLWLCTLYLSLGQITWLAAGLTVLLLLVRLPMGKFYAQSLEEMIRSNTINLDDFSEYQTQLPPQSSNAIRELLTNEDPYVQIKGLELAANLGNSSQFLPEVKTLLFRGDTKVHHGVVKLLATTPEAEAIEEFKNWLTPDNQTILRTTALEILIASQYTFSPEQIDSLLQDGDRTIRLLAAVAAISIKTTNQETAWAKIWQSSLEKSTAKAILRIITHCHQQELVPLVINILPQANAEIKREGLEALSVLASVDNYDLAEVAVKEIGNSEPLVRTAAFKLLGITRCAEMLPYLKTGLSDPHPRVRQQVASALAAYGKPGLSLAQASLSSPQKEVVDTAIEAIAKVQNRYANDILFKYLTPEFEQLTRTRKWQQQIPPNDPSWQPLAIAINDYHQRLIQKVLYILSCLGYSRTVKAVTRILATTEQRDLANAVEVLVSLNHRRFILPLVPLLEQIVNTSIARQSVGKGPWAEPASAPCKPRRVSFGARSCLGQRSLAEKCAHGGSPHEQLFQDASFADAGSDRFADYKFRRRPDGSRSAYAPLKETVEGYGDGAFKDSNSIRVTAPQETPPPLSVKQEPPGNKVQLKEVNASTVNPQWLRNKGYKILLEALESKDRWIRTGALIALAVIPSTLLKDSDPVVQLVAREIFPSSCQLLSPTNSSMNRLLLLKNVALFKNLSLDELFLIDKALEQQQVLSNETIYTEGSWGDHLYIIAEGTIKIIKTLDGEQQEIKQLSQGQYFGEVALFDNAPRWDGAIALRDCTLLKLEKKRFISLITQRPHIILEICRFLSKRLRETDKYLNTKHKL
ncbi:MAG: cyclic nucleotide-binding domain-containing protein [Xenococcaceae cyanobacterium]